jgi:flavin-binding protein dodecin
VLFKGKEKHMADSVYRVTELIGTSTQSWESAARTAVETAARSLRDLRVAEVVEQDLTIENGKVTTYRVKLNVSFKYVPEASAGRAKTTTGKKR